MESVDYWPMAIIIHKTFGGKPKPVAASGVTGRRYPPPERCMLYPANAHCAVAAVYCGPSFGELSGGNWMASEELVVATAPGTLGAEARFSVLLPCELLCSVLS